jgi:hypothetical protein
LVSQIPSLLELPSCSHFRGGLSWTVTVNKDLHIGDSAG